jgi:hypothetical protein
VRSRPSIWRYDFSHLPRRHGLMFTGFSLITVCTYYGYTVYCQVAPTMVLCSTFIFNVYAVVSVSLISVLLLFFLLLPNMFNLMSSSLQYNDLNGTISSSIGSLTNLQALSLQVRFLLDPFLEAYTLSFLTPLTPLHVSRGTCWLDQSLRR